MNAPEGEETIFAEALRLPPEERAAYLAQATSGNAELRRRVESLLGSFESGDFLEQAAAPQLRETRHLNVPLTEKPGDMIGRYLVGAGVVRFAIEFVRRNPAWLIGLTTAQWMSIGAVAAGALLLQRTRRTAQVK